MKRKLTKKYKLLHKSGKKRIKKQPYIIPIVGLLFGLVVMLAVVVQSGGQTYAPSDTHVVRLNVNGQQRIVPTRVRTVGDLLDKLSIKLAEQDVLEPSRETEILEDNFRINVYEAKPVTIIDGASQLTTLSAAKTPRLVAQQAGINVYPEDGVEFQPGDVRQGIIGQKVVINRSTPALLNIYGTSVQIHTHSKTIKDLLNEKGIKLGEGDSVQPNITTPITPNIQIFVVHSGTQIQTVEESIAPGSRIVTDNSLSFGTTVIRQQGVAGKKLVTYQINLENGKEIGRTVIQEAVVQDPVPEIRAVGKTIDIANDKASLMAAAGIDEGDYGYVNYIVSRESGWCYTKWQGQVGYCPAYYQEIHSPSSGYGFGLCQSTPAIKMATAGSDWATNPVTQLRWCSGYAHSRYGSWAAAYNHWLSSRNW